MSKVGKLLVVTQLGQVIHSNKVTPCIGKTDSSEKVRKVPQNCCFLFYWLYFLSFSFSVPVKNILFFPHHYYAFERYKIDQEKRNVLFIRGENNCTGSSSFCFASTASRQYCLSLPKKKLHRALEEKPGMNLFHFLFTKKS